MAGSAIPDETSTSPLSSRPSSSTDSPRESREEAKERRKKAAARALAVQQARARLKVLQQATASVDKATETPGDGREKRDISLAKSQHASSTGFTTSPENNIDTHATSQLDISPMDFRDNEIPVQGTRVSDNNSSKLPHTHPFTGKTEFAEATLTATAVSPTKLPRFTDEAEPVTATQPATAVSPKKLSPTNWAKRDARFQVQFLAMKDETIKSELPGYMSKQMFLEWHGTGLEALKIVNGDKECLLVEFGAIRRVSYNPSGQHLQLIFNTTAQEELQTVVIAMNSLSPQEWVDLQQLFRQVEKKWRIRCDQEDMSFFVAALKEMRKKPYTKMETPYPNRSDAISRRAGEKLPKAPRRQSIPSASQRQPLGSKLNTTSKILKTPKNKNARPMAHLSAEVKNIMAAKVIDEPRQIPRLSTPSKPPSVTSSLMSRTSLSPVKEGADSQRRNSRGYGDNDSPTKRSTGTGSPVKSQVPESSVTPEEAGSPHDFASLFGSDDSEHDFPSLGQPDRTPSQRFNDQMNEAKMHPSSQPKESPKISPLIFDQSSVNILHDRSTQEPHKPEHGFEEFMGNSQGSKQAQKEGGFEHVLASSSPNIRQKKNRSPSPPKLPKLPQPPNIAPAKLVTKRPHNADGTPKPDNPPKKLKESHEARGTETGLYYQCKSGQDFVLPVALNDQVIRLRTKTEMEESGKQSKYDIFDGPWVVLEIFSETAFPLSSDFFAPDEEDSDSAVFRQAEWDRMLKTRVKLSFPEESEANPWLEISRLLPVIDPSYIVTGTPIPSSLEVSTHSSYLKLIGRLGQPLAPGSHNSFIKKSSSDVVDDELYVVEIRKGKFAVFVDIDQKGVGSDSYEVAKIRQKRLRLYTKVDAKRVEATQYDDDKWVKRLLTQHGDIARNKIIVDEYLCSWAGWAVEDQTWVPRGNFGSYDLLRQFDEHHDPLRDIPDDIAVPVDDLVYKDDLERARAALRKKGKRSSAGSNVQSSGGSARKANKKRGTTRRFTR